MKIIELPREGMQSLEHVIPTETKVKYINSVLKAGFDTVEIGSLVSPKLIPQMADTLDVIRQLDFSGVRSDRMILVVSKKGGDTISGYEAITHISYPFSISPTFLMHNMNTTIEKSFETVQELVEISGKVNKQLVVYISMAFGNPYGDPWSMELLTHWVGILKETGVRTIPFSNVAIEIDETAIAQVFSRIIPLFPEIEFGLHLHTSNKDWYQNINAAYKNGCRRFDSVINGWGGCPMSGEELLGNLKTENLLSFAEQNNIPVNINREAFNKALTAASFTFV